MISEHMTNAYFYIIMTFSISSLVIFSYIVVQKHRSSKFKEDFNRGLLKFLTEDIKNVSLPSDLQKKRIQDNARRYPPFDETMKENLPLSRVMSDNASKEEHLNKKEFLSKLNGTFFLVTTNLQKHRRNINVIR